MKLADLVDRAVVDPRKLTYYALAPDAPAGRHKALLFERMLGFTRENYVGLMQQLETKGLQSEALFHSEDQYGKRYTVDVLVEGDDGQQAMVRTGWLVPPDRREAYLVTLYVKR